MMENEDHNYSNPREVVIMLPNITLNREIMQNANQEEDVSTGEEENEPEVIEINNDNMDVDRGPSQNCVTSRAQETLSESENRSCGVRRPADDSDDMDPGSFCTICYSNYDTGVHKLCCLKCGHLFGRSCIEHWLKTGCTSANRKCPTCNTKASLRDIRVLFAKTLIATDTSEINRLTKKIEQLVNEKTVLESALKNCKLQANLKMDMLTEKINNHEQTIKKLLNRIGPEGQCSSGKNSCGFSSQLVTTTKLSEAGGCRVLAYSSHLSLMVASQTSTNPVLFPGFGIRKINVHDMRPVAYVKLHDACIRDICFGSYERSNLLSVSLDCSAKLFDVQSNVSVQTFKVSEPLWSCCWGPVDAYKVFCGSQTGSFYVFDRRQSRGEPEHIIKVPSQHTGFISLCAIPPRPGRFMPSGGILACSLTSVVAFYLNGESYEYKRLPIEGSFLSMRYNTLTDNVLISAKSNQSWKAPRHIVCQLSNQIGNCSSEIDILQTYYATRNPSVLSRSSFISTPNGDQLICAYNDREKTLDAWSMSSDKKMNVHDVYLPDPVLDFCSFRNADDEIIIPCLSDKNLSVVKFKFKSDES